MVQAKFGMPAVAGRQMEVFSTAVLLVTHSPPRSPRKPEWRAHMERMSAISCEAYRDVGFFIPSLQHHAPDEAKQMWLRRASNMHCHVLTLSVHAEHVRVPADA